MVKSIKLLVQRFGIEAAWVVVGFTSSSFALLAGTRVLTSCLDNAEYGRLALAISIVNIFSFVFATPLSGGVLRFYGVASEGNQFPVLIRKVSCWLGWSISCIAIVALTAWAWPSVSGGMITATACFAFFQILNQAATGIEEAARRRRAVAFFRFLFETGRFGFAFILLALVGRRCEWAMAGFGVAGLFVTALHAIFLRKRIFTVDVLGKHQDTTQVGPGIVQQQFFSYIWPLVITGLCAWPYLMLDRWCLNWFCDINDVGVYSAVYQLSFVPATMGGNFLVILISPIVFQHIGDGRQQERNRRVFRANFVFSLILLAVVFLGFVATLFLHGFLGRYLLGTAFRTGSWMLPWLFLSGGIYAVAQQLLLRVSGDMETRKLAVLAISMVVVAGVLYVGCAALWKQSGVVFSAVAVNAIFLLVALVLGRIRGLVEKRNIQ